MVDLKVGDKLEYFGTEEEFGKLCGLGFREVFECDNQVLVVGNIDEEGNVESLNKNRIFKVKMWSICPASDYEKYKFRKVGETKMGKRIETLDELKSLKVGDKVRIVSFDKEVFDKYRPKTQERLRPLEGQTGEVIRSRNEGSFIDLSFPSLGKEVSVDEKDHLELVTEDDCKYAVGDRIRITATEESLNRINVGREWIGKTGEIIEIHPEYAMCEMYYSELTRQEFALNYAHFEKIESDSILVKEGDVYREKDTGNLLKVINAKDTPFGNRLLVQNMKTNETESGYQKKFLELVEKFEGLRVGDKVKLDCVVEVESVNDEDKMFHISLWNGERVWVTGNIFPEGVAKRYPKIEVGTLVFTSDKKIGKVIRDDKDQYRYRVEFKDGNSAFYAQHMLTPIPKELEGELIEELKRLKKGE